MVTRRNKNASSTTARRASPLLAGRDPGARTLSVIAATAAFFAVSALMILAAGTELGAQWRGAFDGAVTVQIPASGDSVADTRLSAELAQALKRLNSRSSASFRSPKSPD